MGRETDRLRRSLVCGVDDSAYGRAAARVAARLAERFRLKLLIVHVTEAPALAGTSNEVGAAIEQLGDRKAHSLLAAVAVEEELGPVERRVEFGPPAERLARVAEEEDAELIVVGSRGRGALRAALLGSVSTELIGIAPCPVLVVPPGAAARA
jgi:nucleotide-binding universal stress UspA family protein